MKAADPTDTARLALLLAELRLPAIKQVWRDLARYWRNMAEQAERQGR